MKENLFQQKAWRDILKRKQHLDAQRVKLVSMTQDILRLSKRAIFAMQRGDAALASVQLTEATGLVKQGLLLVKKFPSFSADGVWRAALEEYAEASIFQSFMDGNLSVPIMVADYPDVVFGGLSDAAGEMARFSVLRATAGDAATVERAHQAAVFIVELLASLDATGSLRTKFDQSKQHLRRIEDIRYDLSKRI